MAPQLRLIADDDDNDDSLGAVFEEIHQEIHRILAGGRGEATARSLGPVLLRLSALADEYAGVPKPSPADRT